MLDYRGNGRRWEPRRWARGAKSLMTFTRQKRAGSTPVAGETQVDAISIAPSIGRLTPRHLDA